MRDIGYYAGGFVVGLLLANAVLPDEPRTVTVHNADLPTGEWVIVDGGVMHACLDDMSGDTCPGVEVTCHDTTGWDTRRITVIAPKHDTYVDGDPCPQGTVAHAES